MMDIHTLQQMLALARRDVLQGEALIAQQKIAVQGLARAGYDSSQAERALQALEHTQVQLIEKRDSLVRQVADYLNQRTLA